MRTCESCGKANNPIRKYCVRCGKPLISVKEEKPSPTPTSVVTETPLPDIQPPAASPKDKYAPSDGAKVTTDDEWVKPSQVSRDRVRSGSSSGVKSEMEKAREAFARAEGVGIEEADGSGVVESRMLRASEVRELMGDEAVLSQQPAPQAQPAAQPTPAPAAAQPPAQPTQQTAPPAQAPPSAAPAQPSAPAAKPATQSPSPPAATPKPTPTPMNKTAPPTTKSAKSTPPPTPVKPSPPKHVTTSPSSISLDTRVPEIEEILAKITEPEDMNDGKIKDLVASLTHQHAELRQVKADLESVSARLDEFVRNCQNDAEVKRIHYESLNEQSRIAKHDYEAAKKEYERVEKRRKKEIDNLEHKVKDVEKGISKTEDDVEKRIKELDKVREKIAQLQDD
jgi:hypothetical protein